MGDKADPKDRRGIEEEISSLQKKFDYHPTKETLDNLRMYKGMLESRYGKPKASSKKKISSVSPSAAKAKTPPKKKAATRKLSARK